MSKQIVITMDDSKYEQLEQIAQAFGETADTFVNTAVTDRCERISECEDNEDDIRAAAARLLR